MRTQTEYRCRIRKPFDVGYPNGGRLDDLETIREMMVLAIVPGETIVRTPVRIRWSMGRSPSASVVHCSVWVRWPNLVAGEGVENHASGFGRAGGHGYCKQSASLAAALSNAGFEFDGRTIGEDGKSGEWGSRYFHGSVMGVFEHDLLPAMARALGYSAARNRVTIV